MREDQSRINESNSKKENIKNKSTAEGWKSVEGAVSFDHVLSDIGNGPY